ncbi:hypothetical protein SMALB_1266 [Streptomyces malaysiensis]|uniref:Uncharacterized protein n=1 Tax=Streptomyces malaysiensis TaxID=92644 RepID=A0A7X6AV42_STRMQ|nr:hypothetical protein [Streptomyces malaysiensis]
MSDEAAGQAPRGLYVCPRGHRADAVTRRRIGAHQGRAARTATDGAPREAGMTIGALLGGGAPPRTSHREAVQGTRSGRGQKQSEHVRTLGARPHTRRDHLSFICVKSGKTADTWGKYEVSRGVPAAGTTLASGLITKKFSRTPCQNQIVRVRINCIGGARETHVSA